MRSIISKVGAALALTLGIAVMGGSIIGGIALAADRGPDRGATVSDPSAVEEPSADAGTPATTEDAAGTDDSTARGVTDEDGDDDATSADDDDSSSARGTDDDSGRVGHDDDHPGDDD